MMDKTYVQCFKCYSLRSLFKIQACDYLIKKNIFSSYEEKKTHDIILKRKLKDITFKYCT